MKAKKIITTTVAGVRTGDGRTETPDTLPARAEEDIDALFAVSLDMVCIADCSRAEFIKTNPAFYQVLGYTGQDLLGQSFFGFIHPDDRGAVRQVFTDHAAQGANPFHFSARVRRKDGSYRRIEWSFHPRRQRGTCYAVGRDVTLRQVQEDALRRVENTLRALLNSTQEAAYLIDKHGIILEHNKTFAERMGRSGKDLRCVPLCDLLPARLSTSRKNHFSRALSSGRVVQFEDRWGNRESRLTVTPVFDNDGAIFELAVFDCDITEIREAQSLIEMNRRRLEALLRMAQMMDVTEQEIRQYALEEVVRLTGSTVGYLHLIDDTLNTIELTTWSRNVLDVCTSEKLLHHPIAKAGIWADSARRRSPVIHNDYDRAPDRKGVPEGHVPLARHMSVPILEDDVVVAVAGVGNRGTPYEDAHAAQMALFMNSVWSILKQKRAEDILKKYSREDALTGTANRRHFNEVLEEEWRRSQREETSIALVFVDIDFFKRYNDIFGHTMGDTCLKRVAESLKNVARRPGDLTARYGGEEFVIILPHTSLDGAVAVAETMRLGVESAAIEHPAPEAFGRVTISLGVAALVPDSTVFPATLIEKADSALYKAKQDGRNCVRTL